MLNTLVGVMRISQYDYHRTVCLFQVPEVTQLEQPQLSSDEEVDFGFWEKAPVPTLPTSGSAEGQRTDGSLKDVDLNLLWRVW